MLGVCLSVCLKCANVIVGVGGVNTWIISSYVTSHGPPSVQFVVKVRLGCSRHQTNSHVIKRLVHYSPPPPSKKCVGCKYTFELCAQLTQHRTRWSVIKFC
jgi:hypothetical protein